MIELYTSLISQFKNFWQYICLGTTLWVFNYYQFDHSYLIGGIFISLGIANILGKITDIIKVYYITWNKKKSQQKLLEEQKSYFIDEYNKLSIREKEIIDCCLNRKTLTFSSSPPMAMELVPYIYSLVARKMGNNITYGGDFAINKLCFDTLLEYRQKNKDKKNG